jgi:hypothetical protein
MSAAELLLASLRGAGARVYAEGSTLWVEPAEVLDDDLRAAIRANKPALLRLLLPENVRWRFDAMLDQVKSVGPIRGLLAAREGAWPAEPGRCVSCGDPFVVRESSPFGSSLRCEACTEAAHAAVGIARARSQG